jgi:hypothetical protein
MAYRRAKSDLELMHRFRDNVLNSEVAVGWADPRGRDLDAFGSAEPVI